MKQLEDGTIGIHLMIRQKNDDSLENWTFLSSHMRL
jgi:hypothetical protein